MKRKPPRGSVRRVHPIGNNYRFFFDSKDGVENQSESFLERVGALKLERDRSVRRYQSQAEKLKFIDENEKKKRYTPDIKVWRLDGSIENQEITLSERRQKKSAQQREAAAAKIYAERGEKYTVFTEEDMDRTEMVNLYSFYGFSAHCFFDQAVCDALLVELEPGVRYKVIDVIKEISRQTNILPGIVAATIVNMIWHQKLNTDFTVLYFIDGERLWCMNK